METTALDILKALIDNSKWTFKEDWSLLISLNTKLGHLSHEEQIYYHHRISSLMEQRNNYRNELQDLHDGIVSQQSDLSETLTPEWFADMKSLASNLDEMVRPSVMMMLNTLEKKTGDVRASQEELDELVKQVSAKINQPIEPV